MFTDTSFMPAQYLGGLSGKSSKSSGQISLKNSVIKMLPVGGGVWAIRKGTTDYIPTNLDSGLMNDGLMVTGSAKAGKIVPGIGTAIEIVDIKPVRQLTEGSAIPRGPVVPVKNKKKSKKHKEGRTSDPLFGGGDTGALPGTSVPPAQVVAGSTTVVPSTDMSNAQTPVMYNNGNLPAPVSVTSGGSGGSMTFDDWRVMPDGSLVQGPTGGYMEDDGSLPTVGTATPIGAVTQQPGVPATGTNITLPDQINLSGIPTWGWIAIGLGVLMVLKK